MFPRLVLLGEASILCVPGHFPAVEIVSRKGMNDNQDVPSECHHTSKCDGKRGGGGLASEEKAISVLNRLGPVLPVHFRRFHKRNISRELRQRPSESFL